MTVMQIPAPAPRYFDMDGQPITVELWAELYADFDARTLGRDTVDTVDGRRTVITVWRGIRDAPGEDLFGTALLDADGKFLRELGGYPTRQAALDGHTGAVNSLR